MRIQTPLILAVLATAVAGCASDSTSNASASERVAVNVPALMADLQAVRSAGEFRTVQNRYARSVSLTVAKALELYVPADYAVFPEAGVDLTRQLLLDRSRTWSYALPAALRASGIEPLVDPVNKTIRLKPAKVRVPTLDN